MSGIFGIFNRNNEPVSPEIVHDMLDDMSYWVPDDTGTLIHGCVALGHTMLWNTPEAKYENLPTTKDLLSITMDARLDNREELANRIRVSDHLISQMTDSDLILAAYRKWGEECPKYLLGEFSFAIWDDEKKLLFCARDHIGIKQFFFSLNTNQIIFSNDIKALPSFPGISSKINDSAVAIYLTEGELWHPSITFFESIEKLPPATTITITSHNTDKKTYWNPNDCQKVRFQRVNDYSESLKELLEDAVKIRLRSESPISSHLSGGLDSSTIATIAARHLRLNGRNLTAYNWVPKPLHSDDTNHYEWANSRILAENENIELDYTEFTAEAMCNILTDHDIRFNDTVDLWYEFITRKKAQQAGVQTILSGWGGDQLISHGSRAYFTDLFWHGKLFKVFIQLARKAQKNERPFKSFAAHCYYQLLVPISPLWIRCRLPRINCNQQTYLHYSKKDFADFARSTIADIPKTIKTVHDDQLVQFNQGHLINRVESWAASAFNHRIEYSYPLLDRRIVEFALGLPADKYFSKNQSRFIFREATRGLLPETLRMGNFKIEPHRVNKFLEIQTQGLILWSDLSDKNPKSQRSPTYIDYQRLKKGIISINDEPVRTFDEEIERTECLIKSVLALRF